MRQDADSPVKAETRSPHEQAVYRSARSSKRLGVVSLVLPLLAAPIVLVVLLSAMKDLEHPNVSPSFLILPIGVFVATIAAGVAAIVQGSRLSRSEHEPTRRQAIAGLVLGITSCTICIAIAILMMVP